MVNVETKPINESRSKGPVSGFVGQAAEVTCNAIELAELQVQLAKADAADSMRIAVQPMLVIAVGLILLLASLPLLLFATAGFIARFSGVSIEAGQLIVALTAAMIAAIGIITSIRTLKNSLSPFARSSREFKQNITWLKTIFRSTDS